MKAVKAVMVGSGSDVGSSVRVGSIVVTRVMGGNVELSTLHSRGPTAVIERADIDDAIEALTIAAEWPR